MATTPPLSDQRPLPEIVGLFHSPEALERAISELASSGWDRAEMSLLASPELLGHMPGQAADIAAHDPDSPHGVVVSQDDVRQVRTLTASMAGVVAAFIAGGATIMTGGAALAAVVGAAAAGGGAAGLAEAFGRNAEKHRDQAQRLQLDKGGILLWAILRRPEDEAKARTILGQAGATHIEVHAGATASAAQS